MPVTYAVKPIQALAESRLLKSDLRKAIRSEHEPFFPDWSPELAEDWRNTVDYRFGPTITEPGIGDRWRHYEDVYRKTARHYIFWSTTLSNVTVEPQFLSIVGRDFIVKESVRLGKDMLKIFRDVPLKRLQETLSGKEKSFTSTVEFPPAQTVDEGLLLGSGLFENYFNWTLRYASRIRFFEQFGQNVKLLVPDMPRGYVRGTLEFFGVPASRVVPVVRPIKVEKLHVIAPSALGRVQLSPQLLLNLRGHPRIASLADTGRKRLYIPRFKVAMRHVVNQEAVMAALEPLGFTVFDNDTHTVAEQAAAFHSADLIVAPHGAGLSNIVYSKPGSTVIEIIPEGYDQHVTSYRSLADLFRLTYIPLFAREVALDRKRNRCNSDIEIDVAELTDVVAGLS